MLRGAPIKRILIAIGILVIVFLGGVHGSMIGVKAGKGPEFGYVIGLIAFGMFFLPLFIENIILGIVCFAIGDGGSHPRIRILTLIAYVGFTIALVIYTVHGNNIVETEYFTSSSDRLPEEFDGFKIAHISDLHGEEMGEGTYKILDILKEEKPDIIVITGDYIDSKSNSREVGLNLAKEALKIAPCYYVPGNYEAGIRGCHLYEAELAELGVTVIYNDVFDIEYKGAKISLAGIEDPYYTVEKGDVSGKIPYEDIVRKNLSEIEFKDEYTILLSHRPDYMEDFKAFGVDLVLSGHYHGGYFRLPFIGGLVGHEDDVLPKYSGGQYTEGNTDMIVSCGIATSALPFRFHNPPEVGIIELRAK